MQNTTGDQIEQQLHTWLAHTCAWAGRVYLWPGTLPQQDLVDMARALPGWKYDSVVIYYTRWDPEIPAACAAFNQDQNHMQARWFRRHAAGSEPPQHIIAVIPQQQYDTARLQAVLSGAYRDTYQSLAQHPGDQE
jgi:hypothetical protein